MKLTTREMLIYEIGMLVGHYLDSHKCMTKYQIICKVLKASPELAMDVLRDTTEAGKELNDLLKTTKDDLEGNFNGNKKDWGDKKEEWR